MAKTAPKDLVDILNKIMRKNIKPKLDPKRQGDALRILVDILKSNLGFKLKVDLSRASSKSHIFKLATYWC